MSIASPPFAINFEPSAERARLMDHVMRSSLAESLRHVHDVAGEELELSGSRLDAFLVRLEKNSIAPLAFSFYFDLVIALEAGDFAAAKGLLNNLIDSPSVGGNLKIIDLGDPLTDPVAQRHYRFFIEGTGAEYPIFSPSSGQSAECRKCIEEAFQLIEAGDPTLAAEIRELLREIILAAGSTNQTEMTFDGSSSFMMWGAILLNVSRTGGVLEMAQMLAHESAHNLLFGMTTEEPLTLNPDDERYGSPLRLDPRPVDGIYHATFVSARMHRCVRKLLGSGVLNAAQHEQAMKDLETNARFFWNGWKTIENHGVLTPTGRELINSAHAAMLAAA